MTTDELIGQVGARYLRIKLDDADDSDDTARYLIDRLSEGQTAAIAKAILADAVLSEKVRLSCQLVSCKGRSYPI